MPFCDPEEQRQVLLDLLILENRDKWLRIVQHSTARLLLLQLVMLSHGRQPFWAVLKRIVERCCCYRSKLQP